LVVLSQAEVMTGGGARLAEPGWRRQSMTFPFLFPPFFGFGFIFYFLPSIVALARSKRNTLSIFLLNFFLGWTLVGWVVALMWAVKVDDFPAPVR